ncbi:hypothetical protein [Microbulbifer sediminum]|uniref:hypothetical protein n=1 Tax=Microbulbifer sediminum TaxID=2904250 RepID=UPI001F1E4718|nr:hypothetical protein [Microbulbifer sediminum]
MDIANDITGIFSDQWSAGSVSARGVKLGDAADCVEKSTIQNSTRLDLNGYAENSSHSELPLSERIASTIEHGGWLQTSDGINYRIENGKVAQFGFFQDALSSLGISQEADIIANLGKPDDIQRFTRHGQPAEAEYYYSNKQLLVIWSSPFNMLLNINIGPKHVR